MGAIMQEPQCLTILSPRPVFHVSPGYYGRVGRCSLWLTIKMDPPRHHACIDEKPPDKHKVSPEVPGKIPCSFRCESKFRTHKELRSHLETVHNHPVECEIHEFHDFETFETWKTRYEETTGYGYTLRVSERVLRSGEAKSHYICHRSGVHKSESKGQRRLKKGGSNKIGTTCPSILEVSRSLADGSVKVVFWNTHIGHDADPVHLPIHKTKSTKKLGIYYSLNKYLSV
ncbi:hypothetical protein AVEN_100137-1 [Araneus ventricosus]|uniref:C2H2-type domain-containing protein n=1 Tax=Araneus ventricosus TaxID=182803 RepID=A0A4Y2DEW4_ARAVE|nr:hypothetical protein AVEN_100137-1 [Araneus ventricosus]